MGAARLAQIFSEGEGFLSRAATSY
uniref:Uncharacterized protein n=1 Tax=Anguilla anguilla TaxID=7936 RepID=A0A0E9SFC1_ANGAN